MDEADDGEDKDQDGNEFEGIDHVVGGGGLADAAHQNDGEEHDDEEGGNVEAEVPAGVVDIVAGKYPEGRRGDRRAKSSARWTGGQTSQAGRRRGRRSQR